jgi:hypothetical protein
LPAIGLSLERGTGNVPADGKWYLLRDGEIVGRYGSRAEAQEAWSAVVAESGWQLPQLLVDPDEALRREQAARWSRNRAG